MRRWTRAVLLSGAASLAMAGQAAAVTLEDMRHFESLYGRWRRWCNAALARDYPPLWSRIDVLWCLQAPGFEVVHAWRRQQEQALQAAEPGRTGMDEARLARFLQHYERISRQALRTLPALAGHCVRLDRARRVVG